MKILIFNWRDIRNPHGGGAEVFTHEIAKRCVGAGNEVTLFTSEFPGCMKDEVIDGVRVLRAGSKYSVYRKARVYYKKYFRGKFDLIVDEINTRPFLARKFVDKGEKIIALIHQLAREFWFYETPFPISCIGYYLLEPRWLRNYIKVPTITVSESTKRDLLDFGFGKIFIVPDAINYRPLDKLPEKEKEPTLLFVGRFKKVKLPDHAVEAFKIVKTKIPNAKLWMVGDGYLRKALERKARDGIKFFGYVPEKRKQELMRRAHVLLVPSVREGWGIVVIEANACGTPAVGYDVPGLRDSIQNGRTGLLVRQQSIEALADAIVEILESNELREKLSKGALEWSRKFSWHRSAEEFMKTLEKIINE